MNTLSMLLFFLCFLGYARDPFSWPMRAEKEHISYVLKGVCVTDEPTAFIEHNGKVCIVGIGERVGTARVFAITDDRVTLHVDKDEPMVIFLK